MALIRCASLREHLIEFAARNPLDRILPAIQVMIVQETWISHFVKLPPPIHALPFSNQHHKGGMRSVRRQQPRIVAAIRICLG